MNEQKGKIEVSARVVNFKGEKGRKRKEKG